MVLTSSASVAPVSSFSSADSIASRPSRLSSKNVWWNWLRSTLLMASANDAIDGCEQLIGIERLDQPAGRTGRLAFLLLSGFDSVVSTRIGTPLSQIGSASCRERGCQSVEISVVAVSVIKKQEIQHKNTKKTYEQ